MNKTFKPCDECGYSFSKQNQESGMCKICEFKKRLQDVKTLSDMDEKLNSQEVSEYHRLKEYEDLEEQGKLLKLPCAVGKLTYWAHEYLGRVRCAVVKRIIIDEDGSWVVTSLGTHKFDDFGKTVFLTEEEAEAALKKLQQ